MWTATLRTLRGGLAGKLPRFTKYILLPKVASTCGQRQRALGAWECVNAVRLGRSMTRTSFSAGLEPAHLAPQMPYVCTA